MHPWTCPIQLERKKIYARQEQDETRIAQEAERQGSSIMSIVLQDSGSDTDGDDFDDVNNMFKTLPTKKPHKRTVKTGTTIALPHDFLKSPTLLSALVRNKITPTAAGAIFHALIEDNNGNASAVNLSYTQTIDTGITLVISLQTKYTAAGFHLQKQSYTGMVN